MLFFRQLQSIYWKATMPQKKDISTVCVHILKQWSTPPQRLCIIWKCIIRVFVQFLTTSTLAKNKHYCMGQSLFTWQNADNAAASHNGWTKWCTDCRVNGAPRLSLVRMWPHFKTWIIWVIFLNVLNKFGYLRRSRQSNTCPTLPPCI